MGYACPVCATPQRDAEHLAHHLAFTAMLHGDGHEAWLDEHAPGWTADGPDELGARVAPRAAETTYEEVFEDTVHDADPGRPFADRDERPLGDDAGPVPGGDGRADEVTRAALAEARALTRRPSRSGDGGGERGADGDCGGGAGGEPAGAADDGTGGEEKA